MAILAEPRAFFVNQYPVTVFNGNGQQVAIYPSAHEYVYMQVGCKPSQLINRDKSDRITAQTTWGNKFQYSDQNPSFRRSSVSLSGMVIRLADSAQAVEPLRLPELEVRVIEDYVSGSEFSKADYEKGYKKYEEKIKGPAGREFEIDSQVDFWSWDYNAQLVFWSRLGLSIHKDALFKDADGIEIEIKRLFRQLLVSDERLVFESIVPGVSGPESSIHSPDLVLLENTLRSGIEVAVSNYRFTREYLVGLIYSGIQQANDTVKGQFQGRLLQYQEKDQRLRKFLAEFGFDVEAFQRDPNSLIKPLTRIVDIAQDVVGPYTEEALKRFKH